MQVKVRLGVFETNSSSSHALVSKGSKRLNFSLIEKDVLKSGVIPIAINRDYGWEWDRIYKPQGKLAYLLTQVMAGKGGITSYSDEEDVRKTLMRKSSAAKEIITWFEEATGCKVDISITSDYGIDHDSVGRANEVIRNKDKFMQFVFSKDAYVQLGNDNSLPPVTVDSDLGKKHHMFEDQFGPAPENAVPITFESQHYKKDVKVVAGDFTFEGEGRFCGLMNASQAMRGLHVTSAEITIFVGRKSPFDREKGDSKDAQAFTALHHHVAAIRHYDDQTTIDKKVKLKTTFVDWEGDRWSAPSPLIKLIGSITPENLEYVKENLPIAFAPRNLNPSVEP